MDHLRREVAPISAAGWQEIENEAKRTLKATLAARRVVDFVGMKSWEKSAVNTGRSQSIPSPKVEGGEVINAKLRRVMPLVELRVPFEVSREDLDAVDRGARDADVDPVIAAARCIAMAEDHAVFHGYPAAGIRGICEAQAEAAVDLGDDYTTYPAAVTTALTRLRDGGAGGPYAIALSERCYKGLTETTQSGYPVLEHVRRLISGPIVWAPGMHGGVVLSMRGGDFELTVGQDFAIGYLDHDRKSVHLYIEESFTFWLLSPQAAIPLAYPNGKVE